MLISDPGNFVTYKSGKLHVHVLALRPNSEVAWDILVTDYTRNDKLKEKCTEDENKLGLSEDQKATFKINSDLCHAMIVDYKTMTGSDLFMPTSVDMGKSRWIEISEKFCFANLEVRLKKNLVGFVNAIKLVRTGNEDFELFLDRFCKCVGESIAIRSPHLLNALKGVNMNLTRSLTMKKESMMVTLEDSVQKPDSAHCIKQEEIDDKDSQPEASSFSSGKQEELFKVALESLSEETDFSIGDSLSSTGPPLSQMRQAPHIQTDELLTQLEYSQNRSQLTNNQPRVEKESTASKIWVSGLNSRREALNESRQSSITSITNLTQIPNVVDGRVYRVAGRIIGFFPRDLKQLCVKLYLSEDNDVSCSGPRYRNLKIFLSNSAPKVLTDSNSLVALIPKESVLEFFSCKHVEQLYTQLKETEKQFSTILGKNVTAEVYLDNQGDLVSWIWRNVTLKSLLD